MSAGRQSAVRNSNSAARPGGREEDGGAGLSDCEHPVARVLVLGLGNDLLTDDAVGLHVAGAVREKLAGAPGITVRETTEMGLALLDEIAGHHALVLVDAIETGVAPPGFIHEIELECLAGRHNGGPHFVGVGETLALGRKLGLAVPERGRIFAIEVADPFTLGTVLTPAVADAVGRAVERIAACARELADAAWANARRPV